MAGPHPQHLAYIGVLKGRCRRRNDLHIMEIDDVIRGTSAVVSASRAVTWDGCMRRMLASTPRGSGVTFDRFLGGSGLISHWALARVKVQINRWHGGTKTLAAPK